MALGVIKQKLWGAFPKFFKPVCPRVYFSRVINHLIPNWCSPNRECGPGSPLLLSKVERTGCFRNCPKSSGTRAPPWGNNKGDWLAIQ